MVYYEVSACKVSHPQSQFPTAPNWFGCSPLSTREDIHDVLLVNCLVIPWHIVVGVGHQRKFLSLFVCFPLNRYENESVLASIRYSCENQYTFWGCWWKVSTLSSVPSSRPSSIGQLKPEHLLRKMLATHSLRSIVVNGRCRSFILLQLTISLTVQTLFTLGSSTLIYSRENFHRIEQMHTDQRGSQCRPPWSGGGIGVICHYS